MYYYGLNDFQEHACELQDAVEAGGIGMGGVGQAGSPLQVCLHLVLQLQLAHAPPSLEVVEVDELVRLRRVLHILQAKSPQPMLNCQPPRQADNISYPPVWTWLR